MTIGRRIVYFGLFDPQEVPGVQRKMLGLLGAARAQGFEARAWVEPFSKDALRHRLVAAIDDAPERHIILRSLGWANMFLWPALMRARRRGARLVIEIASPNRVAIRELWNSPQSFWRRTRAIAAFIVSGPWALWPAHRIVQYAPEGWWFRLGNASRTVQIGNGIDVDAIARRGAAPAWPSERLQLIAVATIVKWQGYDRLFRAMREFNDHPDRPYDVQATIVGDGPDLAALKDTAAALGLQDRVTFPGTVTGEPLQRLYNSAHLAISTIGLHRKGLSQASALKAREYCAVGIPFIAAGDDPDFDGAAPFRVRVSNDENTADLVGAFARYGEIEARRDDDAERRYAWDHLDWRHKLHAFDLAGD